MPELPEVETIRNDLKTRLVGEPIESVLVHKAKLVRGSAAGFRKELRGNKIKNIGRKGKLMYFELENDRYMLAHLKMTGQLIYTSSSPSLARRGCRGRSVAGNRTPHPASIDNKKGGGAPPKEGRIEKEEYIAGGHGEADGDILKPGRHTHVIFKFQNGAELYFNDMRQFGYLQIVGREELDQILNTYGPEPGDKGFNLKYLRDIFSRRSISIKAVLLDQRSVAGLGNIYVDEILHASGVLPMRPAMSLSGEEIERIIKYSRSIIKKAIKLRGTTFNNYRDSKGRHGNFIKMLKVYHKDGQICPTCGQGPVKKIRLAGRGTHFCPRCQH